MLLNISHLVSRYHQPIEFIEFSTVWNPIFTILFFILGRRNYLRKTNKKIEPSEETVVEIKKSKIWQMENELYEFAVQQFKFVKKHMKVVENSTVIDNGIQFKFEKIYPK